MKSLCADGGTIAEFHTFDEALACLLEEQQFDALFMDRYPDQWVRQNCYTIV